MAPTKIPTATTLKQFLNALLQQQKQLYKSMSQVELWELINSSVEMKQQFDAYMDDDDECDASVDAPAAAVHVEHALSDTQKEVVPKAVAKRSVVRVAKKAASVVA